MEKKFYVMMPNAEELAKAGYENCAGIPYVFDVNWEYQVLASKYLRHRAFAKTPVSTRNNSTKHPTQKSMKNFADWLINFLGWIEWKRKDWKKLDYTDDILYGYQQDMQNGNWSARGVQLAARTLNCRVGVACDFLEWAAKHGYRQEFTVTYKIKQRKLGSATFTNTKKKADVYSRVGVARPDPKKLKMPRTKAVEEWLADVTDKSGYVIGLMCELILESGIRRNECALWDIDTLPIDRHAWVRNSGHVLIDISEGTKGTKASRTSPTGPEREIIIPISLAEKLADYRENFRYKQQAKYVRAGKTGKQKLARKARVEKRLFLSETTGCPISAQVLYTAWKDSEKIPFSAWHPHLGRHYWACMKILELCPIPTIGHGENGQQLPMSGDKYKAQVMDVIELVIKPQFGHLSEDTARKYCVWAMKMFLLPGISDAYERRLEHGE